MIGLQHENIYYIHYSKVYTKGLMVVSLMVEALAQLVCRILESINHQNIFYRMDHLTRRDSKF